jgi:hypothetical protein
VNGGELQQRDEIGVRDVAEEMDPRPVIVGYLRTDFSGEDLTPGRAPPVALWVGLSAVGDAAAADDEHMRGGPTPQNFWQRTHEDMKAAVGFEIAVDKRDHLVGARQCQARAALGGEGKRHCRVGRDRLGVDPIMHHGNLVAKAFGKGTRLPVGGADAGIGHLEVQQVVEVFEAQPARITFWVWRGKLRVEADVSALRVVEELAVDAQPCSGPDVFEEQAFAPAGVGDDYIGAKALRFQL